MLSDNYKLGREFFSCSQPYEGVSMQCKQTLAPVDVGSTKGSLGITRPSVNTPSYYLSLALCTIVIIWPYFILECW